MEGSLRSLRALGCMETKRKWSVRGGADFSALHCCSWTTSSSAFPFVFTHCIERCSLYKMSQAQSGSGYPRPDWQRYNQGSASSPLFGWQSLNGRWSFAFDDKDVGLKQAWYKRTAADRQTFPRDIQVPFAFQTQASGIHERRDSEVIWYAIDVPLSPDLETFENRESQTVLRFGAVDYQATVWAAGELVAQHRGGHVPFQADVTAQAQQARASKSALTLVVRVEDRLRDLTQPRGKQVSTVGNVLLFRLIPLMLTG